jgi:hypothetical protein
MKVKIHRPRSDYDLINVAKDHGADFCVVVGKAKGKVYGLIGLSEGIENDCMTFLKDAEGVSFN